MLSFFPQLAIKSQRIYGNRTRHCTWNRCPEHSPASIVCKPSRSLLLRGEGKVSPGHGSQRSPGRCPGRHHAPAAGGGEGWGGGAGGGTQPCPGRAARPGRVPAAAGWSNGRGARRPLLRGDPRGPPVAAPFRGPRRLWQGRPPGSAVPGAPADGVCPLCPRLPAPGRFSPGILFVSLPLISLASSPRT